MGALFALTIFSSAFLLFLVQPLIAKYILPWLGGGPAVWTTCIMFFQVALLAGYALAHLASTRLGRRGQAIAYLATIVAALAVLPVTPDAGWIPATLERPTAAVLGILATSVGLPYLALAATGPLLQSWLGRDGSAKVYRLYAVSNLASLLALLAYPVLVEPHLSRLAQTRSWSWAFAGFAAFAAAATVAAARRNPEPREARADDGAAPAHLVRALWLLLPAATSALLLATTNVLCLDVASVPFLWILPLVLYLLAYVLPFAGGGASLRPLTLVLAVPAVVAACWALTDARHLVLRIAAFAAALFVLCLAAHGELARLKPAPSRLTAYYLSLAAGGALGGSAVALGAPLFLPGFLEYHLAVLACVALVLVASWNARRALSYLLLAGLVALGGALAWIARDAVLGNLDAVRNFHGMLTVFDETTDDGATIRKLLHGSTVHGVQFLEPARRSQPTAYYGPSSGVGRALRSYRLVTGRHIGIVGLGSGTVAAYARANDRLRFYEINPAVRDLAERHFTFLSDCPAPIEHVLGDARLTLAAEASQEFDVLVLDAFSSDAVPVHLLTVEAFEVYLRHLAPGGLIAAHVSNQGLDLRPVVKNLAGRFGLEAAYLRENHPDARAAEVTSDWILMTRNAEILEAPAIRDVARHDFGDVGRVGLWTDERTNLLRILK